MATIRVRPIRYLRDMPTSQPRLSNSRIDKAGKRLRRQLSHSSIRNNETSDSAEDIAVVNAYRQSYADALLRVRMGLTSFRSTIGHTTAPIAQRTKRYDRIILKLGRFETQRLSQMQDIGGVRVVLDDRAGVEMMVERILMNWSNRVHRHDNYVANPQPSGYRAHHIVVERDSRLIEIQVRTENQHTWAEDVELSGRLMGVELKWGYGPAEVHTYYRFLGEVLDLLDRDIDVSEDLITRTNDARLLAQARMMIKPTGGNADG